MWSLGRGAKQNMESPPQPGEGTVAAQTLAWESVSAFAAGFPRSWGILFDSSVFHLVGCSESSSFLFPLVSDVKQVGDVLWTRTVPGTEPSSSYF